MLDILRIATSLPPVVLFLVALVVLDSYKLVTVRAILVTISCGCIAAGAALGLNYLMFSAATVDPVLYVRFGAPVVEETFKAAYVIALIRKKRVGFMVDAAIYGFAIGCGFALAENLYYLYTLSDANPMVWLIRGFGTAIMHGGTTAVFAVMSKSLVDARSTEGFTAFLPGFATAVAIHSTFNHLLLPPVVSTVAVLIVLPTILAFVFKQSEKSARAWLGVGFDTEVTLFEMITKGEIATTRVGEYLHALQDKFRPEVVADLLCYLRIHLELSIQAKGILLMREAGFDVPPDPAIEEQFNELEYLHGSIGKTGLLALAPLLQTTSRDLWQHHMLKTT